MSIINFYSWLLYNTWAHDCYFLVIRFGIDNKTHWTQNDSVTKETPIFFTPILNFTMRIILWIQDCKSFKR